MTRKGGLVLAPIISAVAIVFIYTQLAVFVVQPIGAIPEGRTLIISRLNKGNDILGSVTVLPWHGIYFAR